MTRQTQMNLGTNPELLISVLPPDSLAAAKEGMERGKGKEGREAEKMREKGRWRKGDLPASTMSR